MAQMSNRSRKILELVTGNFPRKLSSDSLELSTNDNDTRGNTDGDIFVDVHNAETNHFHEDIQESIICNTNENCDDVVTDGTYLDGSNDVTNENGNNSDSSTDYIPDTDESDDDSSINWSDDASHNKQTFGLLNNGNTSKAYSLQKNVSKKHDIDNQEFLDDKQKKCINYRNSLKVHNTRQMRNVTKKQGIDPEKCLEASINQSDVNIQQDEIDTLNVPITSQSRRKWDKKDYCFFCEVDVLKFSRHLLRHHTSEIEVQQILALKVGDKRRKILFNKLRNEGNFVKSTAEDNIIPVRKATSNEPQNLSTYLPCKFCKGFYKKTSLFRHIKVCPQNTDGRSKRTNAQADGQSLLATCSQTDSLRREIFPSLRADQISLAAKTDTLICAVARRYLKSHRDKQFRVVASRKMRQLGALLIELRAELKIKSLFDVLNPKNFDALVHCTKKISKYNADTQTYGAPSLAANMGTLIKECIDAAYSLSLKSGISRDKLEELKILKDLIITEWKYEVATIANNNLQQNKWNKPSLIPLAQDLALIKSYLTTESKKNVSALEKDGNNQKSFKTLQEIIYVQLLLLNRRRVGELQRMTLVAYTSNIMNETPSEFDSCVSESEKILMNSFKRVVIRGKRGRGVPVLFTEQMTNNTNLLIRLRDNFVNKENLYLFANINSTTSINGAGAVHKHVRLAGVQNAAAITSTKLRKHLATMSQIINLSPQDLEQLASFMGHTSAIHMNFYRLPDDIYQTAKVSKLLLLSEKGQAAKFKGKRLDEIDINLEIEDEADSDNNEDEFVNIRHYSKQVDANKSTSVATSSNPLVKIADRQKRRVLEPWTKEQKKTALCFFQAHLRLKTPPKKKECLQLKDANDVLFANKSWEKIKIFIVNTYNKNN